MLFLQVVGLAVGFPLLAFAFGWTVLARFAVLDRQERFAAAFGVGFAFLGACQFLAFLLHAPQPLFSIGALGVMGGVTGLCHFTRPSETAARRKEGIALLAGLWALGCLHLLCIQALLPCYVGGDWWGDWHHHFLTARVFLRELPVETEWSGAGTYTVASRTPMFNLVTAFPLNLAGTHFWAFQIASVAPSFAFAAAGYLLLRDLFSPKAAQLGLLLAPLNLWMMHNAWFTWPKMLAAYYLLLGLHFYLQALRKRQAGPAAAPPYFLAFWVAALLSHLTHPVAAVYLAVLLIHAFVMSFRGHAPRPDARILTVLLLAALLILGPWYGWLLAEFGPWRVVSVTPARQMDAEATGLPYMVLSAGSNLGASVVPVGLGKALWKQNVEFDEVYRGLTDLYFSLLPGALSISLSLFLLARLCRGLRRHGVRGVVAPLGTAEGTAVLAFAGLATVAAAFLHPLRLEHGIAHQALFSSVVLLVALGWGVLFRERKTVVAVVCAGMIAEFLALFWSHVGMLSTPRRLDPYDFNVDAKSEYELRFLTDMLGAGHAPLAVIVWGVQLGLCAALLWRLVKDHPEPIGTPNITAKASDPSKDCPGIANKGAEDP